MTLAGHRARLAKLDKVLEAQRKFLHRIPDPDTRERAEGHLHTLVDMRELVVQAAKRQHLTSVEARVGGG